METEVNVLYRKLPMKYIVGWWLFEGSLSDDTRLTWFATSDARFVDCSGEKETRLGAVVTRGDIRSHLSSRAVRGSVLNSALSSCAQGGKMW